MIDCSPSESFRNTWDWFIQFFVSFKKFFFICNITFKKNSFILNLEEKAYHIEDDKSLQTSSISRVSVSEASYKLRGLNKIKKLSELYMLYNLIYIYKVILGHLVLDWHWKFKSHQKTPVLLLFNCFIKSYRSYRKMTQNEIEINRPNSLQSLSKYI